MVLLLCCCRRLRGWLDDLDTLHTAGVNELALCVETHIGVKTVLAQFRVEVAAAISSLTTVSARAIPQVFPAPRRVVIFTFASSESSHTMRAFLFQ